MVIEKVLRARFQDNLDGEVINDAIYVEYRDEEGVERREIGFPYDIQDGILEIGSYGKNLRVNLPEDVHDSTRKIPLKDVVDWVEIPASFVI